MRTNVLARQRVSRRPVRAALATLTVVAVAVALGSCSAGSGGSNGSPSPTGSAGGGTVTTPPAPTSPRPITTTSTPTTTTTAATIPALQAGYLPLWPFAGPKPVLAWQQAYRSSGTQPWHLSQRDTALAFARGYLGYTEVDRVTTVSGTATDALVGVGWLNPNKVATTVATVHLLRFGTGTGAPWEVVGTRDARLSLTMPHYGNTVTSPLTVGGRITGVDESLRVAVHRLGQTGPVAVSAAIPAGGEDQQWQTTLAYRAPAGSVLTIAVSTGGHLMGVEVFAVTGVRTSSAPAVHVTWGSGEKSGGEGTGAPLVNVRAGRHAGYDRAVFDVAGETAGYRVRYVDQVRSAGAGSPVEVAGGARLQVTVLAPTHDPERLITYYMPDDPEHVVSTSGYRTFRQLVWAGSFEGRTEFGLGVGARLPFRVFLMTGPNGRTMVVVDVAHAW